MGVELQGLTEWHCGCYLSTVQLKDYIKTRVMNKTRGERAHYRLIARYGLLASRLEWQSDGYYIIAVNLVHIRKVRGN